MVALVVALGVVGAIGSQLVGALGGAAPVLGVGVGVGAVAGGVEMNAAILRTGFDRSRSRSWSWSGAGARSQSQSWAWAGAWSRTGAWSSRLS